jgi:hypothetical protein
VGAFQEVNKKETYLLRIPPEDKLLPRDLGGEWGGRLTGGRASLSSLV